jgi:hypothetical protein
MQWPFKEWGATATIAGHDHVYERLEVDGFPYFTDGLGGASRYAFETILSSSRVRYNADFGAMLVNATDTNITFQFINRSGEVIDTYQLGTPGTTIAAPSSLTASAVSASQIDLTWSDNSSSETGFSIERCQGVNCTDFSVIGQAGADATSFSDPGLDQASYGYRVRAVSGSGSSPYSNIARASTVATGAIFTDDFEDGIRDTSRWQKGILSRGPTFFDPNMFLSEQGGVLRIKPESSASSPEYTGLATTAVWNMTGLSASVEIERSNDSNALAIFSFGIDSDNWYSIRSKGDTLYFEARAGGETTRTTLDNIDLERFFVRLRHDPGSDTVVFETSPDGSSWTERRRVNRQFDITAAKLELAAGTNESVDSPGVIEFDNFRLAP